MRKQTESSYARIVNTSVIIKLLLWVALFACSGIGVVFWITQGWQATSFSLLLLAAISLPLIPLQLRGYTQAAGLFFYLAASSVITFNTCIGHGIYDEAMLVFPIVIVFSGLILGKRMVILSTGISLVQIYLVYLLAQKGLVQPFDGAVQITLTDLITTMIILLVSGYVVWVIVGLIENAVERVLSSEQELENAYDQTLTAWAKALEFREREDPGHCARVSSLVSLFAEHIGLEPERIRPLWQGALLHDIGKMGIPESILLKPGPFSEEEIVLVRTHTELGKDLITGIEDLHAAREIIAWHHERYDGTGYPDQLRGDEIPYPVQLFTIVDCWDSLRTERPCRPAWTDTETLTYITNQAGKKFHPEVVKQFLDLVDKYGLEETR